MQVKETPLLDLLRHPLQFIPHSDHGTYKSCANSPMDVFGLMNWRCVGQVVYYEDEDTSHKYVQQLPLVSGGQLLTSIVLFIAALTRAVEEAGDLKAVTSNQLRHNFLLNESEEGLLRYKFLPSDEADRESMICLLEKGFLCRGVSSAAIRQDFERFLQKLRKSNEGALTFYYHKLLGQTVFEVSLNQWRDEVAIENLIAVGHQLDALFEPVWCGAWERGNPRHGIDPGRWRKDVGSSGG
jgi:hypothetical protein